MDGETVVENRVASGDTGGCGECVRAGTIHRDTKSCGVGQLRSADFLPDRVGVIDDRPDGQVDGHNAVASVYGRQTNLVRSGCGERLSCIIKRQVVLACGEVERVVLVNRIMNQVDGNQAVATCNALQHNVVNAGLCKDGVPDGKGLVLANGNIETVMIHGQCGHDEVAQRVASESDRVRQHKVVLADLRNQGVSVLEWNHVLAHGHRDRVLRHLAHDDMQGVAGAVASEGGCVRLVIGSGMVNDGVSVGVGQVVLAQDQCVAERVGVCLPYVQYKGDVAVTELSGCPEEGVCD